ncbi:chromosome-anchoring protein RacA [Halalkalibacter nanhaiisediminis]|uniref:Chromosome-anchoring protein RacA n=1 Tax=Halalkalibacter nanhaiisediminis TaxID=688079 RepID=A0A562QQD5_9BACI|nr:chromosome-anchoring protein RacA [Halalkalibacter nanhaiisediminis]TWI58915.1 chromosome-anchoring protein RacA [Halalkalibacter nanhaiisediminis]
MEKILKTKEVSERLGVNPTTVQRWAKYFGLTCETNEHGHYLFTERHVEVMTFVQEQLQEGKRMKEIDLSLFPEVILQEGKKDLQMVDTIKYEVKLEEVMQRVQELEHRISQKADEVVSYQLLKHRSELEDMIKMIKNLEGRLTEMERKIELREPTKEEELPLAVGGVPKKKWRSFMQLFSF